VQAFLEILLKFNYMITLLLVIAFSGHSFDVAPQEVETDVQTMERSILYLKKDAAAEIAVSDVWLEPVHDSTTWPSHECAQGERTAWNGGTQGDTYFK
jgi:hypothetical protein